MDRIFYTLHEFLVHTETVTYVLILIILFAIVTFWHFLTEKDED